MNRSAAGDARLGAVAMAKELHRDLNLKHRSIVHGGFVDVFDVIGELGIPLVFKPLTSALGFCMPKPLSGIMVTTRRGLHIQRFTAAHELGHLMLDHAGSVDREILERDPFSGGDNRDLQEIAADAFAAEFMLPRWLYKHHIRTQGWTVSSHLRDPDIVYQLSLRMGASYEATCWGLVGHQILPYSDVEELRKARLSAVKSRLGNGSRPGAPWSDVWCLTEKDNGLPLIGNPDDLLHIELKEHVSTGHQWQIQALVDAGFEVLSDESLFSRAPILYGAASRRVFIVRPPQGGVGSVTMKERQPWIDDSVDDARFSIVLALEGAEAGGLSRVERRKLGARI